MVQQSTGIWLAIALVLGGIAWVVTQRQNTLTTSESEFVAADAEILFPVQAAAIRSLSLEIQGETLNFEQRFEPVAQWWLTSPVEKPANRGAIAFLLNLLIEPQRYDSFPVAAEELADYGLLAPKAVITLQTSAAQPYQLSLGTENFDQTKIYGRLNDENIVLVLPLEFRHGVTRQFSEWVEGS
ncbi:hypothetical protein AWQ21_11850 [Picosynechococcus sp. PCC 7003]|uniref:DUF4340 domain-containing protein n=1 Tax=Picosynechococcus sp. PCC 7003 TaxID=374981 RepID=UPI000810AD85|nr:DUF4340 domain-containing protein [Picosynechococcus sp. PCC 7003]ANV85006.1 hypothetical protein AWQ21_11850 [Picosynechococcus sp. PCC 7003]